MKKRSKKLLTGLSRTRWKRAPGGKSFLVLFFKKERPFFFILPCFACILLAAALLPGGGGASRIGGSFRLIADDGRVVTDRSFPGKYLLVYFGYSACRDVCPETLNTLTGAIGRLGPKAARVQPLFITVDPERDTPTVLHRYVQAFLPGLIGLSGPPAQIRSLARAYDVTIVSHPPQGGEAAPMIDHSSVIYLMAPDGSFLAPIPAGAGETAMARAIGKAVG